MAYIKSQEHLTNFLNVIIENNSSVVDRDKIPNIDFYTELSSLHLLDKFSWDVKHNPQILHENEFLHWIQRSTLTRGEHVYYSKTYTKEFVDKLKDLKNKHGVYGFFNKDDIPLYIGTSVDLGDRINTSFRERFNNYHIVLYLKYILTKTRSDAVVFETVAIAQLKPPYNTTGNYDDKLTIEISLPEFSSRIACNEIKEVSNGEV